MRNPLLGTSAMAAASFLRVAIQIIILPIIGRLLGPVAYGQIALVSPFIFFAMLLSESGLGTCIVRADSVTDELEGSVFCFSACLSLLAIAAFAAVAEPIGRLIHEPAFPALLVGMSGILFLSSFNIVPAALLLRNQRYGWIALSDVASSLGSIAAVGLGLTLHWGVWSLVAQQIAFWLCKTAVVTLGARSRPRFIFRWSVVKEHFYFGSNLTGAAIVQFLARNIDNILIGALMGSEALGYYALAWQINTLPAMVLSGSVYYMVFSSTSAMHRTGSFDPAPFLKTLKAVLLISAPAMMGLAITAPTSISLILGDKWLASVSIVRFMATMGLCQTISAAISGLLIGLGLSSLSLRLNIIASLATIAAILIGVLINSEAVAAGISIAAVLGVLFMLRAATKACAISAVDFVTIFFPPLAASLLMGGIVYIGQNLVPPDMPAVLRLCLSIMTGILSYSAILFTLFHKEVAEDIRSLRTLLRPKLAAN